MKKQINRDVFHASLTRVGLNASRLADQLGVSREAVSKWQRGDAFPKPDKLLRLGMILKQSYQDLVEEIEPIAEPQVAYRAKANRKTKQEHVVWAKEAGASLRKLVPYLAPERTCPPVLKAPAVEYDYVQAVVADVREKMGLSSGEQVQIQHFLNQFAALDVVLIPVFWGEQKQHGQALHAYLPDSMTTWVWLDLDTKMTDFMFNMAHELGHAYSPGLKGDEAEDFADQFAQSLLCPQEDAQKLYNAMSARSTIEERWSVTSRFAKVRMISPYTVIKAVEGYACATNQPDISFGKYGSRLPRFNRDIQTVSEVLFGKERPDPEAYIKMCSDAFGTQFFSALRSMKKEAGLTPPFLTKTMDLSFVDSKAIFQELG